MLRLLLTCFLFLFLLGNAGAEKPRSIKVINEPLPNVLQKITKSSGIQFKVSDTLMEERVSAKIQGDSWDEVANKLLDNFNLVELRDGKGSLIKVYVLGLKGQDFVVPAANEAIQPKKRPLKKSEIVLNMDQLRELAKGPFPTYMLHVVGLRNFLSLHGISSDEEMANVKKAMRVRAAARRQLKMLQEK